MKTNEEIAREAARQIDTMYVTAWSKRKQVPNTEYVASTILQCLTQAQESREGDKTYTDLGPDDTIQAGDEFNRHGDPEAYRPGWYQFPKQDIGRKCGYFGGWSVRRPVSARPIPSPGAEDTKPPLPALNPFKMSAGFLTLVFHEKINVAKGLGLWVDSDTNLSDVEMAKAIFNRAKEQGKLLELQAAIFAARTPEVRS